MCLHQLQQLSTSSLINKIILVQTTFSGIIHHCLPKISLIKDFSTLHHRSNFCKNGQNIYVTLYFILIQQQTTILETNGTLQLHCQYCFLNPNCKSMLINLGKRVGRYVDCMYTDTRKVKWPLPTHDSQQRRIHVISP